MGQRGQEGQGDMEGHWEMWGSPMGDMGIQTDVWNAGGHKDVLGEQRSTGGWDTGS